MITQSDLEKVAKLAKLGLTPEESVRLTEEIEKIIGYFQQIRELNLENVPPMTHAVSIILPLRYDEIRATKCIVDYLPYKKFNYFFVPTVLE
jgi:aspartyl-tRNA(Asn)/glutamyl-tRNA(Gln) amidotransferase subunit C